MTITSLVLLSLLGLLASAVSPAAADEKSEFFERKIRPVLVKHCYECHSAEAEELGGNLFLDSRPGTRMGGDSGAAVVPGKPQESLLLSAIEYRDYEMPPEGKLPDDVIADFRRWIRMGAPDPRDQAPKALVKNFGDVSSEAEPLWSLQPVRQPELPEVSLADWPYTSADHFVLAGLDRAQLKPVADAPPHSLLRRVYFDLTGLPPSPEELAEFEADPSREAFAEIVDRLLASPQFGERWARHWFDVVRYGESAGNSRDVLSPYAWRYRDYVIDAFNDDIAYDQFLREQIAGDLLAAETADPAEKQRLKVATGFLAVGSKSLNGGNTNLDLIDDQIDVIGKAMLGLTVACARCHDHKFDPIPTADYYALVGIFKSTDTLYGGGIRRPKGLKDKLNVYLPVGATAEQVAEVKKVEQRTATLQKKKTTLAKQVQQQRKKLPMDWQQQKQRLAALAANDASGDGDAETNSPTAATTDSETGDPDGDAEAQDSEEASDAKPMNKPMKKPANKKDARLLSQIEQFEKSRAELKAVEEELESLQNRELPEIALAVGVQDARKIADSPIHLRGERNRQGDVVPRGFLSCVESVEAPKISESQSGRRELAQWLTDPNQPLTPRVMVNRVWQHLFGRGLVQSVDNFGINGTKPTHPELLDHLAWRFVHVHDWSVKELIRELTLSHTYALSTTYVEHNYEQDPENQWYWRMSRRRLEAEAIRDAMLANSGELRRERYPQSIVTEIGEGEVGRGINTKPLRRAFLHRAVYLPIIRGLVPEFLKVFDLPEPSNPKGQRDVTNVPTQSLYLLNSSFVIDRAEALARRMLDETATEADAGLSSREAKIQRLFRICLTRNPTPDELERSQTFLDRVRATTAEGEDPKSETQLNAWTLLCQSLLASAEYRFLD